MEKSEKDAQGWLYFHCSKMGDYSPHFVTIQHITATISNLEKIIKFFLFLQSAFISYGQ